MKSQEVSRFCVFSLKFYAKSSVRGAPRLVQNEQPAIVKNS